MLTCSEYVLAIVYAELGTLNSKDVRWCLMRHRNFAVRPGMLIDGALTALMATAPFNCSSVGGVHEEARVQGVAGNPFDACAERVFNVETIVEAADPRVERLHIAAPSLDPDDDDILVGVLHDETSDAQELSHCRTGVEQERDDAGARNYVESFHAFRAVQLGGVGKGDVDGHCSVGSIESAGRQNCTVLNRLSVGIAPGTLLLQWNVTTGSNEGRVL